MRKDSLIINMDDATAKRRLMMEIGKLSGLWEVWIKPRRKTRTLNQNAYYWAAVAAPFAEWLREQYGDAGITVEQAHEMLKAKVLGFEEKTIKKGETLKLIPRSKTLSTVEFGAFVDDAAAWMAEFCGIVVLPPELFFEQKENHARTRT